MHDPAEVQRAMAEAFRALADQYRAETAAAATEPVEAEIAGPAPDLAEALALLAAPMRAMYGRRRG